MRVLFFTSGFTSAPVRVVPLLETLRAAGDVEAFACVNGAMAIDRLRGAPFDVVLAHRTLGRRQFRWLRRSGLPFVYDVDDLILRDPAASLDAHRVREQAAVRWCLTNAHSVTSPSRRLLATLERRLGRPFGARAIHLPNAALPARAQPPAAAKPSLLWVCSHGEGTDESRDIAAGVAAAARDLGTTVTLIGRFPEIVRAAIPVHRALPWLEPQAYRRVLAEGAFVAAAPLPVALAPDAQAFVDCKSDIKAVEFASLGIAGLYSPAPPYTESDMPCVIARSNSAADWQHGLVELARTFPAAGTALATHPALADRQRNVLARRLFDALSRARAATGGSFRFRSLRTPSLVYRLQRMVGSAPSDGGSKTATGGKT